MRHGETTKPWVPGSRVDSHFLYSEERRVFDGSIQTDDFSINVSIDQAGLLMPGNDYKITTPTYRSEGPSEMYIGMARMVEEEDGSQYLSARLEIPLYEEPIYCRIAPTVLEKTPEAPQSNQHLYNWTLTEDNEDSNVAPAYPKWERTKDFFRDATAHVSDWLADRSPELDRDIEP